VAVGRHEPRLAADRQQRVDAEARHGERADDAAGARVERPQGVPRARAVDALDEQPAGGQTRLVELGAQARAPQRPPGKAPSAERTAVGLPIVTSDGKAIGKVVATGVDDDNQPVLVGEIERQLGLGLEAIAIPTDLFVRKEGRIELTITEDEVNARLAR